jgi:hypothetical protein
VEGGREELAEVWPSRASSSWTRSCNVSMSAWATLGVAAQIWDGRGGSASFIDCGIPPRRSSRKLLTQGGPERLRSVYWGATSSAHYLSVIPLVSVSPRPGRAA